MKGTEIKKYFLGELDETDANILEEELAVNIELTEFAQMVEDELVCDYLQSGLSKDERLRFEKHYLTTPTRIQKLKSTQFFLSSLKEKPAEIVEIKPQLTFWQSLFGNFNLSKAFVFGALTILLFGGFFGIWWNWKSNNEVVKSNTNQSPTPIVENTPTQIVENTPTPINTNVNSINSNNNQQQETIFYKPTPSKNTEPKTPTPTVTPTPDTKPTTSPTPKSVEPIKPTLATFTLLPGTLRSSGEQSIKISPETTKVHLRLSLPKDSAKYQSYQATIKTADGTTIFTASNLKSSNLHLPANKFSNKTYIVFLEGISPEKPAESIAEYTFRVKR